MSSILDQLQSKKGKIVWLASYPKSGNTWLRCFLSALLYDTIDLNNLSITALFSDRNVFEKYTQLNSGLLLDHEAKRLLPKVYEHLTQLAEELLFVKVHDAYDHPKVDGHLFPSDVTHKVVYLIRNPLDIAGSLAHHNGMSIESSINLMNDSEAVFAQQNKHNTNNQFPQLLYSWSKHVKSWTLQQDVEVLVIRYEDMLTNTRQIFGNLLNDLGLKVGVEEFDRALKLSSFENLKEKEDDEGFREKNPKSHSFFRKGSMGDWKNELSPEQVRSITDIHADVMHKFDYLP